MKKIILILCLLLVGVGLLPLALALTGTVLAEVLGCDLSPTGPEACLVMGVDLGPTLTNMMMMHWGALISLPIAALGVLGMLLVGLISLIQTLFGKRSS